MIKYTIVVLILAWRVLIEEDKDNSLQFTKVFPAKFLKLPIHQSFPLPPFCAIRYVPFSSHLCSATGDLDMSHYLICHLAHMCSIS